MTVVRAHVDEDLEALARAEAILFEDDPWGVETFRELVEAPGRRLFVAERDDITGGWVVRNEHVPGRVALVTDDQCSCRQGAVWGICKHIAAVEK